MAKENVRLTKYDPGTFRRRFDVIVWIVFLAFFFLAGKLWFFQVIRGDELRLRSESNRIRFQEVRPLRGLVLDRNGNILVDNMPSFDVSMIPELAKNSREVLDRLTSFDNERTDRWKKQLDRNGDRKPFVPVRLERDVSWKNLAIIESNAFHLPGFVVDVVPVRDYRFGETAAHILGYVGEAGCDETEGGSTEAYRPGDMVGKTGIEKMMDRELRGASGGEQIEVNVSGRKIRVLGVVPPRPGNTVVLTLRADLQRICWEAFREKAGSVIVMDPRDGSILAMVSKPSFDPNLFNRGISEGDWRKLLDDPLCPLQNRPLLGLYPPGSLFKLIIAAAGLEEKAVTPEKRTFCTGNHVVGDRTFRCWNRDGHGSVDLRRAIVESCDIYFYELGEKLGVDTIARYARMFGLGKRTEIGLPGEQDGLVPSREWKLRKLREPWQIGETVSLAIGQGFILTTPLQLLRTYCALGNGGILFRPKTVDRILSPGGESVREVLPEVEGVLPLDQANRKFLLAALRDTVHGERATGKALKELETLGVEACGKTGTAQVVKLAQEDQNLEKIPYKYRDHALFVSLAPYPEPEIAVMVVVEHGGGGGSVAAPIAREILMKYFKMKKDGTLPAGPDIRTSAGTGGAG
jgi:penicillin-binding protein 2